MPIPYGNIGRIQDGDYAVPSLWNNTYQKVEADLANLDNRVTQQEEGEMAPAITITEAADLDSFTTPGLFYFSTSNEENQNFPVGTYGGHLFVLMGAGSSIIRQIFIPYYSQQAAIYTRLYNNSTWGPWNKVINSNDVFVGATSDAAGARGLVPAPSAGNTNTFLKSSGGWGRDSAVTDAVAAGQIGSAKTVTGSVNLDDYQTQGFYYFVRSEGNTYTNFPAEVGGYMMVITGSGSSLVRQIYYTNHATKAETYTRLYIGDVWKEWTKLVNFSDVFSGATSEAAGTRGLVPAPSSGDTSSFLKSNGTWGRDAAVTGGIASGQLGGAVMLGDGSSALNLNDYINSGTYYISNNHENHQNFPMQLSSGSYLGGSLIVIRGASAQNVRQIFIANAQAANVYTRLYTSSSGGNWGAWRRLTPDADALQKPATTDGVGKWTAINKGKNETGFNAASFVLPSGGTWAYAVIRVIEGNADIGGVGGMYTGVAAGGSTITPTVDGNYTTNGWRGLVWRIA